MRTAVYELLGSHDGDVVIDLSEVDTVDVTALKVLAVATRAGRPRRAPPDAARLLAAVRRMLHLSHLTRVVEVDRDRRPRDVG